MAYVIAELREDAEGGFNPRGAVKELWQSRDFECIISGPAETGKTYGSLQYADALLWKYPGANGVMARKTYASLVGSALSTYKRIIGHPDSPIKPYGGEKPEWFDYPNGSRMWLAGLDNPGKALSTERDFIYVNQAEELAIEDWETLSTRCTGRGATMPYTRIFGDCNPWTPTHWIKNRSSLRLLESRHEDNPTLFDENGEMTEQGKISLSILDNLTGTRYLRLRKGVWVQAEGAVYENFDTAVHLVDRFHIPQEWARYWVVDFGYTNPFVWQAWAEDSDGRLYRYREIYRTKTLVEDHAARILELTQGEPRPRAIICDHDAEDRATLERYLRQDTTAAIKTVSEGIQNVAVRLNNAGDGKPRLFYLRDSLDQADPDLVQKHKPICTEQEYEVYVWQLGINGKPDKEAPVKDNDHGMDASRYMVQYRDTDVQIVYSGNYMQGQSVRSMR